MRSALSAVDDWWPQGTGVPAVGAGYTFEPRAYKRLSRAPDFLDRLAENEYGFVDWGGYVRCWRTQPLDAFLDAGSSLDIQARELSRWARKSTEDLTPLDPGPIDPET